MLCFWWYFIYPKINLTFTPDKNELTKRLSTIIKSSQRRPIVLDSELRKLSKEFRYLLSGKKLVNEDEPQKKLCFNENNQINEENNESSVDEESVNQEEVEKMESEILKKVLIENFGHEQYRSGQLETIKSILNGKVNKNLF